MMMMMIMMMMMMMMIRLFTADIPRLFAKYSASGHLCADDVQASASLLW